MAYSFVRLRHTVWGVYFVPDVVYVVMCWRLLLSVRFYFPFFFFLPDLSGLSDSFISWIGRRCGQAEGVAGGARDAHPAGAWFSAVANPSTPLEVLSLIPAALAAMASLKV